MDQGVLQGWGSPDTILLAINLQDPLHLVPHAVAQAKLSDAKILLPSLQNVGSRSSSRMMIWPLNPCMRWVLQRDPFRGRFTLNGGMEDTFERDLTFLGLVGMIDLWA